KPCLIAQKSGVCDLAKPAREIPVSRIQRGAPKGDAALDDLALLSFSRGAGFFRLKIVRFQVQSSKSEGLGHAVGPACCPATKRWHLVRRYRLKIEEPAVFDLACDSIELAA